MVTLDITKLTYDDAERLNRNGSLSDAEFEHYRYLWRNGAYRYSSLAEQFQRVESDGAA